jgi:uncharacterized protein (TIGR03067 family)
LTKAGLTLPAALPVVAGTLAESLAVPEPLAAATVNAALTYAGGHLTGAALSPQAVTLAQGELTMFKALTVLKCLAAALLVSGVIGGGLIAAFPDDSPDAEDRAVRVAQVDGEPTEKAAATPERKNDQENIQGTWKIVEQWSHARQTDQEELDKEAAAGIRMVISKTAITYTRRGDADGEAMKYTLDPSQTPQAIDFQIAEGQKPTPGIYELKGDTLRILYNDSEKDRTRRPTKLPTKDDPPGKDYRYLVLQREDQKPVDKTEEAPKVSSDEAAGTELEKLLQERQEVLKEAVDVALAGYKVLRVDYMTVLEVQRDLIQAQLEQATREQKIALYKRLIENWGEVEEIATVQRQAGRGTQLEILKARAARLEAQIELVRAQSAPED